MIVVMRHDATQTDLDGVLARISEDGLRSSIVVGTEQTIVGGAWHHQSGYGDGPGRAARGHADIAGLAALQACQP